ncbi:hypothetical protein [Streptomyces sp. NPDC050287]|uniref:hypothetical protein n=1 Tax=Streptomyces sp. NPDC050287 TaxID=3365608 RepID=UPI0037B4A078
MTFLTRPVVLGAQASALTGPAPERRDSPLLAAAGGRQDRPVLPALVARRASPGPLAATIPAHPHCTPVPTFVPTPAHLTPRAVRVRRSPR